MSKGSKSQGIGLNSKLHILGIVPHGSFLNLPIINLVHYFVVFILLKTARPWSSFENPERAWAMGGWTRCQEHGQTNERPKRRSHRELCRGCWRLIHYGQDPWHLLTNDRPYDRLPLGRSSSNQGASVRLDTRAGPLIASRWLFFLSYLVPASRHSFWLRIWPVKISD